MPRGDKSSYTDKQKRQAEHIEEGYKEQGLSDATAERRAWATVNKQDGGGKKSGSGRKAPAKKASTGSARKTAAKKSSTSGARKSATKKSSTRTSSARTR